MEDEVRLLGRTYPRATRAERGAWGVIFVGLVTILSLAAWLTPDPSGVGTHRQIPFMGPGTAVPPCGFLEVTGYPCPSCGFTTTFTLAMHGQLIGAVKNQPFGFCAWLGFCTMVPVALASSVGGVSPLRATDHWRWRRFVISFVALWLAGWVYKMKLMGKL